MTTQGKALTSAEKEITVTLKKYFDHIKDDVEEQASRIIFPLYEHGRLQQSRLLY